MEELAIISDMTAFCRIVELEAKVSCQPSCKGRHLPPVRTLQGCAVGGQTFVSIRDGGRCFGLPTSKLVDRCVGALGSSCNHSGIMRAGIANQPYCSRSLADGRLTTSSHRRGDNCPQQKICMASLEGIASEPCNMSKFRQSYIDSLR